MNSRLVGWTLPISILIGVMWVACSQPAAAKAPPKKSSTKARHAPSAPPPKIAYIAAGDDKTCAMAANGKPVCWGRNDAEEIGPSALSAEKSKSKDKDGRETHHVPVPATSIARAMGKTAVTQIAVGGDYLCFLRRDKTVWCKGSNARDQRGDETAADDTLGGPQVSSLAGAVEVAGGLRGHVCARLANGGVKCWGDNQYGGLCDGGREDKSAAMEAGTLAQVASLSAGAEHSCAVLRSGQLRCWGRNNFGQLGDGTVKARDTATPVAEVKVAVEVAAGDGYTCARLRDKTVTCWGRRPGEVVGEGDEGASSPAKVEGIKGAVALAAGKDHACALGGDKVVYCWGMNQLGQLGDGTRDDRVQAAPVKGMGPVAQIAAGRNHTCARLADGTLRCWGSNKYGQIIAEDQTPYFESPTTVELDLSAVEEPEESPSQLP